MQWRSAEEAMLRTGIWGGMPAGNQWHANERGGSNVIRSLPRYAADSHNMGGSAASCEKYQKSAMKLIPGFVLLWCLCCRRCVMFGIMRDAEPPRTLCDMMVTHLEEAPELMQFDNGRNLQSSALAREPEFFSDMRVLIDQAHFRGHKNCSANYSTGGCCSDTSTPYIFQVTALPLAHPVRLVLWRHT